MNKTRFISWFCAVINLIAFLFICSDRGNIVFGSLFSNQELFISNIFFWQTSSLIGLWFWRGIDHKRGTNIQFINKCVNLSVITPAAQFGMCLPLIIFFLKNFDLLQIIILFGLMLLSSIILRQTDLKNNAIKLAITFVIFFSLSIITIISPFLQENLMLILFGGGFVLYVIMRSLFGAICTGIAIETSLLFTPFGIFYLLYNKITK